MRRSQVLVLLALASGLMSVLLAVAVNVATGGRLPGRLAGYEGLAWPAVALLAAVTVVLAFWQQHLQDRAGRTAFQTGDLDDPTLRPGPALTPAELPEQAVHFAGRTEELTALRRLIDAGANVVAIAGTAGVGKSALALHLARTIRGSYPDGQLYARLRGATAEPAEPQAVLARFLTALGAGEAELRGDTEALAARYRTRLAGRRVLVLLDDAGDERQVRHLLPGEPGCLTLITSRPVLGGLSEAALFDLGVMGEQEAAALLAALVGAERLAAEPEATAEVLRACGYLPLAVGIAGGRLRARRHWTVAALAARLSDERHRLNELRLGNTEVRASFATSYAELSEPDRRLFRRLGVHPGSELDVGAAAALAGADRRDVAAALERLADVRLVEVVGVDRYWRHDLTRLFAAERLAAEEPPEARDAAFARVVAWYADAAAVRSAEWFWTERDNLLATVRRAVDEGAGALAWRLIDVMVPLAEADPVQTTHVPLWRDIPLWAGLTELARADADPRRLARGLLALGRAYDFDGYVESALEQLGAALAASEDVDDPLLHAQARKSMGHALRAAGRHSEAVEQYQLALELYRSAGRPEEEADVLDGLGTLYITRHETANARRHLERAMQLRREISGPPSKAAWTEMLLGVAHMHDGQLVEARSRLEHAMAVFADLGDRAGEAYTLRELGWLAWNEHRYADAVRLHADAEQRFTRISLPVGVAMAQESGGDAQLSAGNAAAAVTAYERSAATFRSLGDRAREGLSLLKLAEALTSAGRPRPARARRAEAERQLAGLDLPEADAIRARLDAAGTTPDGAGATPDDAGATPDEAGTTPDGAPSPRPGA